MLDTIDKTEYGLTEAALLSSRVFFAIPLPDVLARSALVTSAVEQLAPPLPRVILGKQLGRWRVKVVSDRPLLSTLLKSIEAITELLNLPPGWNSYAAKPIAPRIAIRAIHLLAELAPQTPPDVVPRVQGGIQLEWHTEGFDLEVYLDSPEDVRFLAEDAGSGDTFSGTLAGNQPVLRTLLQRASGK
jgi:hypothetical protein